MKDWQRIREAMDACRPGSQDLQDPELRDLADALQNDEQARNLFERTQRLDAKVRSAIRQVDVPAGLEQRLLAQLAAVGAELETSPSIDAVQPATAPEVHPERTSRRRFWFSILATTAAGLLIAVGIIVTRPSMLTLARLGELATDWTNQALQDGDAQWKPVAEDQLSPVLRRASRWRPLDTDLDPNAIVLDLSRRGGKRLFVFQFKPHQQVVPLPLIPYQPLPVSGQWHMGAWKENGVVHIAVTNDRTLLDSLKAGFQPT